MRNPIFFYALLSFLIYGRHAAPVRTILCCCGCDEEPCPIVGPDCPDPKIKCDESKNLIRCSALQRLFEISQLEVTNPDEDYEIKPIGSEKEIDTGLTLYPEIENDKYFEETPSEMQKMRNGILEISVNKTKMAEIRMVPQINGNLTENQISSLNRISQIMNELEDLLSTMRSKMSTYAVAVSDFVTNSSFQHKIDATIQPHQIRVLRQKRAESENCNDEKLKKLIKENIKDDAKSSKRAIQKAANKAFNGHFNVICSPCEFSFVVASQKYCDGFKEEVACFAFLQPPSKLKIEE